MTALRAPIIHAPRCDLPVLLSVPHSGRDYPRWLVNLAAAGEPALTALEDPYVDRLVWRAVERGIGAVIARAPRAAVDCNRSEDEVDPAIIEGGCRSRMSARARGGLGIVPARTQRHGHLWRRAISAAQLRDRLDQAHRPYHAAIGDHLRLLADRFGGAVLIDCHSMPPPPRGTAAVVLGDRESRSADPWVASAAADIVRRHGFGSSLNHPFAGGHVVERHGRPSENIHALQLEIDRRSYLDHRLSAPGPGFDRVARLVDDIAVHLGEALLRRRYATAAE